MPRPVNCPRCSKLITVLRDIITGWCEDCKDWTMPDQTGM